jgi:predicted nucleic acid-binding protein
MALILPHSGRVYVDTSIFIYSVEKYPGYFPLLAPLWSAVQSGAIDVVSSELAYLETLVVPLRNNNTPLIHGYEGLFAQAGVELVPISRSVLKKAALLRAKVLGVC